MRSFAPPAGSIQAKGSHPRKRLPKLKLGRRKTLTNAGPTLALEIYQECSTLVQSCDRHVFQKGCDKNLNHALVKSTFAQFTWSTIWPAIRVAMSVSWSNSGMAAISSSTEGVLWSMPSWSIAALSGFSFCHAA